MNRLRKELEDAQKNLEEALEEKARKKLEEEMEKLKDDFITKTAETAETIAAELSNQRREHEKQLEDVAIAHNKVIELHHDQKAALEAAHNESVKSLEARITHMEREHE